MKDVRLSRRFNHLCSNIALSQSAIINRCYSKQKDKMGAYRFLNNTHVDQSDIISHLRDACLDNVSGKSHVLCIQDSSEINYDGHSVRMKKKGSHPGVVSHHQCGTFLHPLLVIDAASHSPLGFSYVKLWNRADDAPDRITRNYRNQPIEEKESYRWLESGLLGCDALPADIIKTIIGDREADIFELFRRVPSENVHLLIRSTHERSSKTDEMDSFIRLNEVMSLSPVRAEYVLPVLHGSGRKKRQARMTLRFEKVILQAPSNGPYSGKEPVSMYCIHVKEKEESVPENESPIEWRLLTTHTVTTVEEAHQCLEWYRCRWFIEELFRILKRKGFMIEDSQLENIQAIQKLILVSLQAALKVMMLKISFDNGDEALPASYVFKLKEVELLHIVNKKYEGATKLQKNPYKSNTMPWAAWIIARLGAWSGYKSQSIPGYITIKEGLEKFYAQLEIYELLS